MISMNWLETHIGDLNKGIDLINKIQPGWNLEVHSIEGVWYVYTGRTEKKVIFSSDERDALNAFLYGMALACVSTPDYTTLMQTKAPGSR